LNNIVADKKNIGDCLFWFSLTPLVIGLVTLLINGLFIVQHGDSFENFKLRFLFGGAMVVLSGIMQLTARSFSKSSKDK